MPCLLYKFHALDETQKRPVAETILKEPCRLPLTGIVFHGRAGTDEVTIAVGLIDTTDIGPEFILCNPRCRICGLFTTVWPIPIGGGHDLCSVGGIFQKVVRPRLPTVEDVLDF